jgi:hypothetical protein
MKQTPDYYLDQYGNPITESVPREGDSLDVGFGGPIGNLMEKLAYAKQIMDHTDEIYPYAKTGIKKTGKITTLKEEAHQVNTKSLKSLREDNIDENESQSVKQLPKSIQSKVSPTAIKPNNKQPLYEDDNYIYYTKDGVQEDDEYDVRKAPSLTSELLMATQKQDNSKSQINMNESINERMIKESKLPDVIKQSFLKNPLTPPKITAALGGAHLDAITEEFRKQKQLKNTQTNQAIPKNVIAVPKKQITKQKVESIPTSKREKIKAQLKPIVEELIREILLEKF